MLVHTGTADTGIKAITGATSSLTGTGTAFAISARVRDTGTVVE